MSGFRPILTLSAVAAALSTAVPTGLNADNAWMTTQRTSVFETVSETLEVLNPHGNITVRFWPDSGIEVSEFLQRHADDPWRWRLAKAEEGRTVRISTSGSSPKTGLATDHDSWRKRRVDLVLYVPDSCRLVLETRHGDIKVKHATASVNASSISGTITIASDGPATARSSYGDISVTYGRVNWAGKTTFETITGAITANLPPDATLVARMSTRGALTSDYSMTVSWAEESLMKTATIVVGAPSDRTLELRSNKGDLAIRRSNSALIERRLSDKPAQKAREPSCTGRGIPSDEKNRKTSPGNEPGGGAAHRSSRTYRTVKDQWSVELLSNPSSNSAEVAHD